jgi:hypothetical protein
VTSVRLGYGTTPPGVEGEPKRIRASNIATIGFSAR